MPKIHFAIPTIKKLRKISGIILLKSKKEIYDPFSSEIIERGNQTRDIMVFFTRYITFYRLKLRVVHYVSPFLSPTLYFQRGRAQSTSVFTPHYAMISEY